MFVAHSISVGHSPTVVIIKILRHPLPSPWTCMALLHNTKLCRPDQPFVCGRKRLILHLVSGLLDSGPRPRGSSAYAAEMERPVNSAKAGLFLLRDPFLGSVAIPSNTSDLG